MTKTNKMSFQDILKKYNLLLLLLFFTVLATILSPNFLSVRNIFNILRSASFTGIMSIGMTFVILTGGIDLSVGYMGNMAGMLCCFLIINGMPILPGMILGIVAGGILGFVSGSIIQLFKLPPYITTLAMQMVAQGVSLLFTNGNVITGLPEGLSFIGKTNLFNYVPLVGIIWIVLTIISALLLKYTPFGRRIYAIGGNQEAAYLSGINVKKYSILVFVISGCLAAFAGVLMASYLTVGQPTAIVQGETNAIASVVIGGTSMRGGFGGVVGTFGGVILMQIITNIFNLVGVPPFMQYIFKGVIIVAALILNKFVSGENKQN
ncbi:MAG: ABC transporter permease [Clostridiaceae bacterium]|nr:ABC transporter permease [Clostridiaceae bacterium]